MIINEGGKLIVICDFCGINKNRIQELEQELAKVKEGADKVMRNAYDMADLKDRLFREAEKSAAEFRTEAEAWKASYAQEQAARMDWQTRASDAERRLKAKESLVSPVEARALQVSHSTLTESNDRFREMNGALKKLVGEMGRKLDDMKKIYDQAYAVALCRRTQTEKAFNDEVEKLVGMVLEFEKPQSPPAPLPQRQDSLKDQMVDVKRTAERIGCYDAADWIQRTFFEPVFLPQRQDSGENVQ